MKEFRRQCGVGDHPTLDQALAVAGATCTQPSLVHPQHVRAAASTRPLADVGQNIHITDELTGELREDLPERVGVPAAEGPVGVLPHRDGVIDVHGPAVEAV